MTLEGDAKLKGKLTCGLKNVVRNLINFHASSCKSEHMHVNGLVLSKSTEELCLMTLKSDKKKANSREI